MHIIMELKKDVVINEKVVKKNILEKYKKLSDLVGYCLSIDKFYELLYNYNKSALEYKYCKKTRNTLERYQKYASKNINKISESVELLDEPKNKSGDTCYDNVVFGIQDKIKRLELELSINKAKRNSCNEDTIKFRAIMEVFEIGLELGLKSMEKPADGGSGNKNKLFQFVGIITDIEDKNTLYNYYKKYKKLKEKF